MRIEVKIWISIILLLLLANLVCAQTYDELLKNTSSGKDISEQLPPLADIMQLAIENSPLVKINDVDVAIGKLNLKEEKRAWLNNIGFEGISRYGLYDNLVISEDFSSLESNTSTTEQLRFYFGAYLKVPLYDIIDRSNVKSAKAEIEKLGYQREVGIQNLRQMVILRYTNVIKAYRNVIIKANTVENFRMQMIRADVDFNNVIIDIGEYVRLSNMQAKAVLELEEAKVDYSTALVLLEEITGEKINLNK